MYGLAVNLIVSVSGHPWIINEIFRIFLSNCDSSVGHEIFENVIFPMVLLLINSPMIFKPNARIEITQNI